jgi:TonB dependent receptor-like, beta-barrel/CarboxypepD_reg-like domain
MKSRLSFILTLTAVLLFYATGEGICQATLNSDTPRGTIKGKVIDAETKSPLGGVSLEVVGTDRGAVAGPEGGFSIDDLPVGGYVLRLSHTGYEPLAASDIIVRSGRITSVAVELKPSVFEVEGIVVEAGYFSQTREQPTGSVNFSSEEIRRAPGSAGDVSRILSLLPSIAKVNDQTNSLIVRGGSPVENAFYIDHMEIPNINHYPTLGSSGGPIGLLNVDFIQDANFSSGGFSAAYGDRLSSVMELSYREGNRDRFLGQMDMNMTGLGLVGEGPLAGGKGSWLFSARRSYLDLLVDAIGTGVAPRYSDYQGKLTFDVTDNDKISFLGVLGVDFIEAQKEDALDDGNNAYGLSDIKENLFGMNWRHLWGARGYSNTSVSHMFTKSESNYFETVTERELLNYSSQEQAFQLRNENSFRLNRSNRLKFGIDAKHIINEYDNFLAAFTDPLGNPTREFRIDDRISANKAGAFASHIWQPLGRLETTLGLRWDYFSFNGNSHLSPRFSFSYKLTERTSLNGSAGVYYQNLPLVILSQNIGNKDLKDPVARHYVVGFNHLLSENTRLTLEVYNKEYRNFPLDPSQPPLFVLDELFYDSDIFFNHDNLVDTGKAYTRGVELVIQKKLARDFYGLVSGSYFRSRYRDYDGVWRDRIFDNRYLFSVEGGYKPSNKWEYSVRWVVAGGPPFTPFDIQASQAANKAIFDRDRINQERKPAYHSLNVRFDRRFNFSGSNLILYMDFWNVYNRQNIVSYYWNEAENKQDIRNSWSFLPVMGMEWEF